MSGLFINQKVMMGMSKKDFKKAVGGLYKSKQIAIHEDCISLL